MENLLRGRVAIITGAASGIGRAASLRFAEAGASIVVADVDEAGGQQTVSQIGDQAVFVHTDVSSAADAEVLARTAIDHFGHIDILYNNAATTVLCNERDRPVHELEEWVWDTMLNVCLKGVFLCSKYVLPHMMAQKRGVIINTSTVDALVAEPGFDSYTAAKGGVISLTRSMAAEYAPYNIPRQRHLSRLCDHRMSAVVSRRSRSGEGCGCDAFDPNRSTGGYCPYGLLSRLRQGRFHYRCGAARRWRVQRLQRGRAL